MGGQKESRFSAATLDLYDAVISTVPGVSRKGAASAYTALNGNMFSFLLDRGKMALRLPPDEHAAFRRRYRTGPCVQHGAVMKEYVVVPASLLQNTGELVPIFERSHAYVKSLKPKPTTRPK